MSKEILTEINAIKKILQELKPDTYRFDRDTVIMRDYKISQEDLISIESRLHYIEKIVKSL